jgi:hypothetical protein
MTLPRKGRRSITVDGRAYHYQIAIERSERVVVQSADGKGAFLFVLPFALVKPSHVANAIRFAFSRGWTPTQNGEACWLAFDVDAENCSHFEHILGDDFRVVTYSTKGLVPDGVDASQFSDTRPWYRRPSPAADAK